MRRRIRPCEEDRDNSEYTLRQGLRIIGELRNAAVDVTGDVLELGTGWVPIIPLLFHLAGSRRLILTDIERLMDDRAIAIARAVILRYLPLVARTLGPSEAVLARRLGEDFTPDYLVPWNSRTHPANSADVIYSRAVLEHIPPPVLEQLLVDFSRILRAGGGMCHVIDNSDHWEHQDKTLSRVDFLQYGDGLYWKLATLDPQWYQNRLRHGDYLRLFRKFGWTADLADGYPDEKCLRDLETLKLAARFRGGDRRDLAVLTSTFILRSAAADAAGGDRPQPPGSAESAWAAERIGGAGPATGRARVEQSVGSGWGGGPG